MPRLPYRAAKVLRRVHAGTVTRGPTPSASTLYGYGGVVLGRVRQGVLRRRVTDRHLFRQTDGWSLGAMGADRARRAGVTLLSYHADDGVYTVPLDRFIERAARKMFPTNAETQLILPRREWTFIPHDRPRVSQQQSLFAVAG